MLQYTVWTALCVNGMGATLQVSLPAIFDHFSPKIHLQRNFSSLQFFLSSISQLRSERANDDQALCYPLPRGTGEGYRDVRPPLFLEGKFLDFFLIL
jgi:hypothetical protein